MKLTRYWLTLKRGFLVTFHLSSDYQVRWVGVYGVQIGTWFFGAVKSRDFAQAPKSLLRRTDSDG